MSVALDAAIRAVCREDCASPQACRDVCQARVSGAPYMAARQLVRAALSAFLNAVENSQQPISHDAMQTLREHLGE